MILLWLIVVLLAGGLVAWHLARWSVMASRWCALSAVVVDLILAVALWLAPRQLGIQPGVDAVNWAWLPQWGIRAHLTLDGLSMLLLLLTFFLGIIAVLASWTEIKTAVGFFHLNLLWTLAGIAGVFLAANLFLFYFAWELMLVPMYFLISIWGHENRGRAAVKFFIFTQLSGLLMLLAILGLFFVHYRTTGVYTFEYRKLLGTAMPPRAEMWLMLGFFIAFAVKLPVVVLHTWLPDAHTEAPTAGSVLLAGLLLKTGAYGMLRFVVPLFPHAAVTFASVAMGLGVAGILYGALLAFGQTDLKRLIAYTSVSHLGFVLLGIFALTELSLQGAVMTMLCHGISTGALFVLAGALQKRMETRDMRQMGGLWTVIPRFGGATLFFALASLGLPGLGDFVGEFLVLVGSYRKSPVDAALATVGVLFATFYALRLVQQVFHGRNTHAWRLADLVPREGLVVALMIATLLGLGLYPRPVLQTFQPVAESLQQQSRGR